MSWDSHNNALQQVKNTRSINSYFSLSSQLSFSKSNTIAMPTNAVCAELVGNWPWQKRKLANSCDGMSKIFQTMFSDSNIHLHFSMGANKCFYIINLGFGPFFPEAISRPCKKVAFFNLLWRKSKWDWKSSKWTLL